MPPKKKILKKSKRSKRVDSEVLKAEEYQKWLKESIEKKLNSFVKYIFDDSFFSRAHYWWTESLAKIKELEIANQQFVALFKKNDSEFSKFRAKDFRDFLFQWDQDEQEFENKKINWLLRVDELSRCSHDYQQCDMSMETVRKMQPNIGDRFVQKTRTLLELLQRFDENENEDSKNLYFTVKEKIKSFINGFIYDVLSNIDRDMVSTGPFTAEYSVQSEMLLIDLFTYKNMPLPSVQLSEILEDEEEDDHEEIKKNERHILKTLWAEITIPDSMELENLALIGLHLLYDHFSELTSSIYNDHLKSNESTFDFLESVTEKRKILTGMIIEHLYKLKEEWKTALVLAENAKQLKEKMSQTKKGQDKKKKKLKKRKKVFQTPPTEPVFNDAIFYEIYSQYREIVIKQCEELKLRLSSDVRTLQEHEVNLRKYHIQGGVFHLHVVDCPQQHRFFKNKIIYHINQSPKSFVIRNFLDEEEAFEIVLNLSSTNNYWWEEPIICKWEQFLDDNNQNLTTNFNRTNDQKGHLTIEDFNLNSIPEKVDLHYLMVDHIIPRLSANFQLDIEVAEEKHHLQKFRKQIKEDLEFQQKSGNVAMKKIRTNFCFVCDKSSSLFPTPQIFPELKIINNLNKDNTICLSEFIAKLDEELRIRKEQIIKKEQSPQIKTEVLNREMPTPNMVTIENIKKKIEAVIENINQPVELEIIKETRGLSSSPVLQKNNDNIKTINQSHIGNNKRKPQGLWSTRDIISQNYDAATKTMTIRLRKLGIFACAINKYQNLPFKDWNLKPHDAPDNINTVRLTVTGFYAKLEFTISPSGYTVQLIKSDNDIIPIIKEPTSLEDVKQILLDIGLNVFPDNDADYYMGILIKDRQLEYHTYDCIGICCLNYEIQRSPFCKLEDHFGFLIQIRNILNIITDPAFKDVAIRSVQTTFVKDIVYKEPHLFYNISSFKFENMMDLYHLCYFDSGQTLEINLPIEKKVIQWNVVQLLKAIKPLSYS